MYIYQYSDITAVIELISSVVEISVEVVNLFSFLMCQVALLTIFIIRSSADNAGVIVNPKGEMKGMLELT